MYHVIASYMSADTLDIISLVPGVPISSSSFLVPLLIRKHCDRLQSITVDLRCPQKSYSPVLKVVDFETAYRTLFLVYTADDTWTQIDAKTFSTTPIRVSKHCLGCYRDHATRPATRTIETTPLDTISLFTTTTSSSTSVDVMAVTTPVGEPSEQYDQLTFVIMVAMFVVLLLCVRFLVIVISLKLRQIKGY